MKNSRRRSSNYKDRIFFIDPISKGDRIITKYFDPKYTADVENGRLRFGTNRSYKNVGISASHSGTLDDETEGNLIFDFDNQPSIVKDFETPFFKFVDSITPSIKLKLKSSINDHTFCATIGSHDAKHHAAMLNGGEFNGIKYIGNPRYSSFCEIDLRKFIEGVSWRVLYERKKNRQKLTIPSVFVGRVTYNNNGKSIRYHGILPYNYSYSKDWLHHYITAAFSKPARFSIEKEIRLLTPVFELGKTPTGADAKFFQSRAMAESIIRMGTM